MQGLPVRSFRHALRSLAIAVCVIFFSHLPTHAQPRLEQHVAVLWRVHEQSPGAHIDYTVDLLFRLNECYRLLLQPTEEDSVLKILIDKVLIQNDAALTMKVLNRWFSSLDLLGLEPRPFHDTQRIEGYVRIMKAIANNGTDKVWECQAWCASARYRLGTGDYKMAGEDMSRAWREASRISSESLKIRCLLLSGYCKEQQHKKLEAFQDYADALFVARHQPEIKPLARCYEQFADFYTALGNYTKAGEYLSKTIHTLLTESPVDSVAVVNQLIDLVFLLCTDKKYDKGIRTARLALDYALRNGNLYLKRPVFATIKSVLMEHGEYRRLKDFYIRYYPEELERVALKEPGGYYQLRAAFGEADVQPDTALLYYKLAKEVILSSPRPPGVRAFFLRRYGHFLVRWGRRQAAVPLLDSALRYAVEVQYLPYMAELSGQLDSISAAANNIPAAYHYAKLNKRYSDALNNTNRQDEILIGDLENELRSRELLAIQEVAATRQRHHIQYMGITLIIGICFLVLLMLGSFRPAQWVLTGMGFFSFIFLFEFIILLIDHKLHKITHGEPWMILAIKLVIMAGLSPLHHWAEHRVVKYLHTHQLIDTKKLNAWLRKIGRRSLPPMPVRNPPAKSDKS